MRRFCCSPRGASCPVQRPAFPALPSVRLLPGQDRSGDGHCRGVPGCVCLSGVLDGWFHSTGRQLLPLSSGHIFRSCRYAGIYKA